MGEAMEPAGQALGRFVANSQWADLDPALRHEAERSLLNFFGGALGVARDPAVTMPLGVMQSYSGVAQATVIGQSVRLDSMSAAFVNAIAANLLDYDDTHLNTVIHPTAPVAPPALALAEQLDLPGAAVLHAFILGAEVECRIGNAVSPNHYARGWHITSTCGVFGSAAACSKLLGLDAEQTSAAIGLAASQSAGIVENLASAAKNVGMGNAARNGLLAALLARNGYRAAPLALEGPLGWARAMGDVPRLDAITGELGDRWEFRSNTYKPYPSGIVFHAVIDACLVLRNRLGASSQGIAEVIVRGNRLLLDRGDRKVATERDARVSIHHSVAVVFVTGRAGVAEFAQTAVDHPAIAALRQKVRAELDPAMPAGATSVTVRLQNGEVATMRVDHARGSESHPLSDQELEAKFRDNAALGGTTQSGSEQIAAIWSMADAPSVRPLMALMAAHPGHG
jgi:2-methylcitrate dehydratase PrpD